MIKLIFFVYSLFLIGCQSGGEESINTRSSESNLDLELSDIISNHNITASPAATRVIPSINSSKAQLGMKLFFSKVLGGDFDSACVTCHHPFLGGGDDLPLSIGVGADDPDLLGLGRTHHEGDFTVPRNAPSTFNMLFWDKVLFWDGRVQSRGMTPNRNGEDGQGIRTPDSSFGINDPEAGSNITNAQARFPVTSIEEMKGFSFQAGGSNQDLRAALIDRLNNIPAWRDEFFKVYSSPLTDFAMISSAIGEYQRTQVFVNTPWKNYVEGDKNALSESAKNGAKLFFNSRELGGADCSSCHSGNFFTDENFYSVLAPQIGRGKGDGSTGTSDFGRQRETGNNTERYTFRVPTLLNVEVTGPYYHSGAYSNLEDAVRHHLNPEDNLQNYDLSKALQANTANYYTDNLEMLSYLKNNNVAVIDTLNSPINFTDQQIKDLVEFLKSLTDPCVKDKGCLSQWIPDESHNIDGLQLKAKIN